MICIYIANVCYIFFNSSQFVPGSKSLLKPCQAIVFQYCLQNCWFSLVSRGQTAYFSFDMGAEKNKGLHGILPLHVLCRELSDFGDC